MLKLKSIHGSWSNITHSAFISVFSVNRSWNCFSQKCPRKIIMACDRVSPENNKKTLTKLSIALFSNFKPLCDFFFFFFSIVQVHFFLFHFIILIAVRSGRSEAQQGLMVTCIYKKQWKWQLNQGNYGLNKLFPALGAAILTAIFFKVSLIIDWLTLFNDPIEGNLNSKI